MTATVKNTTINNLKDTFDGALLDGQTAIADAILDRFVSWANEHFDGNRDLESFDLLYETIEACLGAPAACSECGDDDEELLPSGICLTCTSSLACTPGLEGTDNEELDINDPDFDPARGSEEGPTHDEPWPEESEHDGAGLGYYEQRMGHKLPGAGDVSGDDQNRHYREQQLGYKPASDDWANSHRVIRCIWPKQKITRPIDADNEYFHFAPAIIHLDVYYNRVNPEDFKGLPTVVEKNCTTCKSLNVWLWDEPCNKCIDSEKWAPRA
jgi:hypothetical protein